MSKITKKCYKSKKKIVIELEISNNMGLIIQTILEFFKKNNMKIIKLIELVN